MSTNDKAGSAPGALAGAALIVVVTAVAYLPAISGGFLIDDDVLLTDSRLIKAADGLYRFWFTGEAVDYWPVSNSMLWLEWRLWGMHSSGYHLTNLILHIIESLLIWRVLQQLAIPGAFLAALLFALHPVNVESVAWIAQRKNLLAMLFFLLSVLAYLRSEAQSRRFTADVDVWYWAAFVAFVLAMLSKVSATVLLPLLLLVVAWMRPLTRRDLARTLPFFLAATALVGVNLWFRMRNVEILIQTSSITERLLTAAGVVWFYLYKALLPFHLVFMYPRWPVRAQQLQSWLPLLAALLVTSVLWLSRRSWSRPALFAWVYFWVALLPAMGFTEQLVIEDHYQHVALIGVVALVAAGWETWRRRAYARLHPPMQRRSHDSAQSGRAATRPYAGEWFRRGAWLCAQGGERVLRQPLDAAAIVVIVVLAALTWRQASLYSDNVTLMGAAVETHPDSASAQRNLGFVLLKAGRLPEAREHLEEALRIDPDDLEARKSLGATLTQAGELDAAIGHFERALQLRPDDPAAQHNLGELLRESGRPQQAIEHFEKSLRVKPDSVKAHCNLAKALLQVGRRAEAIEHFRRALQINPEDPEARHHLAALSVERTP